MSLEITIDGRLVALPNGNAAGASVEEVSPGIYSILHDGKSYELRLVERNGEWRAMVGHFEAGVDVQDPRNAGRRANSTLGHLHQDVKAPMPGKVIRVLVSEGDDVQPGAGLAVVEAMKMQNELKALRAGRVLRVAVKDGDTVSAGDVLVTLE